MKPIKYSTLTASSLLRILIIIITVLYINFHGKIVLHQVMKSNMETRFDSMEMLRHQLPNLPDHLTRNYLHEKPGNCGKQPGLFDIHYSNIYWQQQSTSNGTFLFYSAYWDNRTKNPETSTVRVLSSVNRKTIEVVLYCRFWYGDSEDPVVVMAYDYRVNDMGPVGQTYANFRGVVINCPVPSSHWEKVPGNEISAKLSLENSKFV